MEEDNLVPITKEMFFNIVKDWEKKDISTQEKGRFILAYKNATGKSYRELEKELGFHHNTLQDWVSGRQMRKYYDNKINEELSNFHVSSFRKEAGFNGVDTLIDRLLFVLTKKEYRATDKTKRLLKDLKSELERMEL